MPLREQPLIRPANGEQIAHFYSRLSNSILIVFLTLQAETNNNF